MCDEIRDRVDEGRLILFEPCDPGACIKRPIYLSVEVQALVDGPWKKQDDERRSGALRAELENFSSGGMIGIAREPYNAKTALLAQLDSPRDEVWEIRSRSPKPSLRIFGRFAKTTCL